MRRIIFAVVIVLALLLLTHATTGTALAGAPAYHCVQPGETMTSIAGRYGVSTWSLAYANGVWNPNWIYVGQMLVIPTPTYCYACGYHPYYPVKYYPRPTYGCYHWVQYGDTMLGIAARYGGNAWTIARANGIYNLNWIYAGQRLFIPGCN
ncbi:MAG: LysM peptidoglycan-binding domain-containing protein [Acidobacteriota bacterium]